MDRRSWLWRRKSSEKSPGESESSGSISSERFSDDQAYPTQSTQSPELTSKAVLDDGVKESVKALTEKLSAALINISAKEDLIKQHAKVAEEAVSGWEKAESEVLTLKQQLEAANKKNAALEDRVVHLDGALKECMRQLRQAKEDQGQKIQDLIAKSTCELESTKSILENKVIELQAELTAKTEAMATISSSFHLKLEAMEKENSTIKLELYSLAKELETRTIERDLSTQAAESASKQHLDSIKKMTKLESELRKVKAMARKKESPSKNNHKSFSPSSIYAESFSDNQSDIGEKLLSVETDLRKARSLEPNVMVNSLEIDLMDDFLEMERIASLPGKESESASLETGPTSDQPSGTIDELKSQLEIMIHRTSELEEKIEILEFKKMELETDLTECQKQLEASHSRLKELEVKSIELCTELDLVHKLKQAAEREVNVAKKEIEVAESEITVVKAEVGTLLSRVGYLEEENEKVRALLAANVELKQAAEREVNAAKKEIKVAESEITVVKAEVETLLSRIGYLEEENEKERALSAANVAKCLELEDELSRTRHDAELQHVKISNDEFKTRQEKELAMAADKFAECQKTIASLGRQLKSLATLDDFLIDPELPSEFTGEGLLTKQNNVDSSNCIQVS